MIRQFAIRGERPADADSIHALLKAVFGGGTEANVVNALRARGETVLTLVAEEADGNVVGYVAFPRLSIAGGGRSVPVVGLAPLGVAPERQRNGIGSALVRTGIAQLRDGGETLLFVLGDPEYYRRFGFAAMDGYVSPYAGPYFQALALAPGAPASGRVAYPQPFADL